MEALNLICIIGGYVDTNGYILELPGGHIVFDAPKGIFDEIQKRGIKPKALFLTHQHFDHVDDVHLFSKAGIPVYAYQGHSPELIMDERAREWGLPVNIEPFEVTDELKDVDLIKSAGSAICPLKVPGHSPDSIAYYLPGKEIVFAGDTLFDGSIGRTDLPFGEHETLLKKIKGELFTLPADTRVFPGHGEETSILKEKRTNQFLQG